MKSTKTNVVSVSAEKVKTRKNVEDYVQPGKVLTDTEIYIKSLMGADEQEKNDKMKIEMKAQNDKAAQQLFDKLSLSIYFTSPESHTRMNEFLGDLGIYNHTDMPTLQNLPTVIPEDILNCMKQSLKGQFQAYCTWYI